MILGIGIDTIEIARFAQWYTYPIKKLQKVFSLDEIQYCLSMPSKASERFAARFAAKEAFFKAAAIAFGLQELLPVARYVQVGKTNTGAAFLQVAWQELGIVHEHIRIHLSLSHNGSIASAVVIIESCKDK